VSGAGSSSEEVSVITLPLPYDKPPLSMNQRMHWAEKARVTANVREAAFYLALSHKMPKNVAHASIQLHYAPKVHRRADPVNLTPTSKALVDGLIDYGLCPDDDPRYVTDLMPLIHHQSTTGKGQLWLEIEVTL
jgi:crossover junction endodeoxyribonuclease RusA